MRATHEAGPGEKIRMDVVVSSVGSRSVGIARRLISAMVPEQRVTDGEAVEEALQIQSIARPICLQDHRPDRMVEQILNLNLAVEWKQGRNRENQQR